jgi:hypothetical protein
MQQIPTVMQFTSATGSFISNEEKNKAIFRIPYNASDYFYLFFFILFFNQAGNEKLPYKAWQTKK